MGVSKLRKEEEMLRFDLGTYSLMQGQLAFMANFKQLLSWQPIFYMPGEGEEGSHVAEHIKLKGCFFLKGTWTSYSYLLLRPSSFHSEPFRKELLAVTHHYFA